MSQMLHEVHFQYEYGNSFFKIKILQFKKFFKFIFA